MDDELPTELNIVTLNCWGTPGPFSKDRVARLTAIGRYLATCEPVPQIVALQEVWSLDDWRNLRRETRFALPFGKLYRGGGGLAFGTGLAILSRWPFEQTSLVHYPLSGHPSSLWRGGCLSGSGVACARIRFGEAETDVVEVFNTHIHACNPVHQLAQSWELAKLVRGAAERGHLAVALGDFGTTPMSLPYRLLTAHAPVRDAWRVLYPDSSLGASYNDLERSRRRQVPSAAYNVADNGATLDSAYNTWAWSRSEQRDLRSATRPMLVPPDTPDPKGRRTDYIFFSRGGGLTTSPQAMELIEILSARGEHDPRDPPGWIVGDVRVGAMARHPELGCSLSDHFSVEVTLLLHTPSPRRWSLTREKKKIHRQPQQQQQQPDKDTTSKVAPPPQTYSIPPTTASTGPGPSSTSNTNYTNTPAHPLPPIAELPAPDHRPPPSPRPTTSSSSSSAGGAANPPSTLGGGGSRSRAALERGVYLSSPAGSELRLPGTPNVAHAHPDTRAARDAQLAAFPFGEPGLPSAAYDEVLASVRAAVRRPRTLYVSACLPLLGALLVLLPALAAGVAFVPAGGPAVPFVLVAALACAAAAAHALLALAVRAPCAGALAEFAWEMRNARASAAGEGGHGLLRDDDEEDNEGEKRKDEGRWV
ncbi:DNase I-like protein [Xylariomycetidae sp. FL0641]|nr:DNase I-like protein [Xylariomycetidae sp. FL0641]